MCSVASPDHTPRCHCQARSSTSTFKLVFSLAYLLATKTSLLFATKISPTSSAPAVLTLALLPQLLVSTDTILSTFASKSVPATSAAHTPKFANGHTVISGSLTHRPWSRIFDITGKSLKGFGLVKEGNVRRVRRGRDCRRSGVMQIRHHCLRHGLRPRPHPKRLLSPGLQGR